MVDSRVARAGMITAGAVLALGLAGCQVSGSASESGGPQPAGSDSVSSGPSASDGGNADGGTSSGGTSATVPVSSSGHCTSRDLRLTLGQGDSGMGTTYRTLVFRNFSGHPCTIQGFPGVSYVTGDNGSQVGAPAARTGGQGPSIRLADGEAASSGVGFVNVHNFDAAECKPTNTRGIRVYQPGETAAKFLGINGTGCANSKVQQLTVKALQRGNGQ